MNFLGLSKSQLSRDEMRSVTGGVDLGFGEAALRTFI
jgi:hypothetical protein